MAEATNALRLRLAATRGWGDEPRLPSMRLREIEGMVRDRIDACRTDPLVLSDDALLGLTEAMGAALRSPISSTSPEFMMRRLRGDWFERGEWVDRDRDRPVFFLRRAGLHVALKLIECHTGMELPLCP
jgi:hypothetical protein